MAKKPLPFDAGDASDLLADKLMQRIVFRHVPTGQKVSFKAFLTAFDDAYESNWNKTQVYGRMDPIMTFQGTERVITIGWDVVAYSAYEAYRNMQRVSLLLQMLYPVYEGSATGHGQVLSAAPLFKLKFMNLAGEFKDKKSKSGLIGTVSGFTYSPDVNAGFYNADDGSVLANANKIAGGSKRSVVREVFSKGRVYPQSINLQCTYTVLHSHPLGWTEAGTAISSFPYGVNTSKDTTTADASPAAGPAAPPGDPGSDPGAVILMDPLEVKGERG